VPDVSSSPIVIYVTIGILVLTSILSFSEKLGGRLSAWAKNRRRAAQEANDEYVEDLKERLAEMDRNLADARSEIKSLRDEIHKMQTDYDSKAREDRAVWERREVTLLAEIWKYRQFIASTGVDPNDVKGAAEGHREGDA